MGLPQTTPSDPEKDPLHRRIVLLGRTGAGKSATGNTILGEKRFRSELSSSSVTSQSEIQCGEVSGRNVSVIDTPAIFDTALSPEKLGMEIGRSIYLSSPGPHAFLYVQPVNIRFTEQEENVIQKLELIFGREMRKYTTILFTHGDQLEEKSVEELIQENRSLRRLVNACGGRYHIFNNKHLRNREQVSELLQKIDRMVEENGGTCYSTELYEEAQKKRREKEFLKKNRSFFVFCGVIGVVVIGAPVGVAIVGGVMGGIFGVAIGGIVGGIVGEIGVRIAAATQGRATGAGIQDPKNISRGLRENNDEDEGHDLDEGTSDTSSLIHRSNVRKRAKAAQRQNQY